MLTSNLLQCIKNSKIGINSGGVLHHERQVAINDGTESQQRQLGAARDYRPRTESLRGGNRRILAALRAWLSKSKDVT
jgi:hypothetical protein